VENSVFSFSSWKIGEKLLREREEMMPFQVQGLGMVMEAEPGNQEETRVS
jgi:hypothetical protein